MPASPRDHCTGFRLSRRWHRIDNPLWYNNNRRSDFRKEFEIFFFSPNNFSRFYEFLLKVAIFESIFVGDFKRDTVS